MSSPARVRVDGRAVGLGAVAAGAIALPAVLLGAVLDQAAFAVVVLAGFVVGGTVAGFKRPDAPYTHGLLAASAACVATSVLSIATRAVKGDAIHPAAYAFNLLLAAACGCAGAFISERRSSAP